jgi:hypothetical protein
MEGLTFCVTTSRGTFDGRALRAKRRAPGETVVLRAPLGSLSSPWRKSGVLARAERSDPSHMVWLRITAAARHAGCHSVVNLS